MNLFYTHPSGVQTNQILIKGQEAFHISRVLRYKTGDKILTTDGQGTLFECVIQSVSNENITAAITGKTIRNRPLPYITLCIGIIKKRDRLEFAAEKAAELGADKLILFRGDHSEKGNVRKERVEAAVLAAMKQSNRVYLPEVFVEESLKQALEMANESDQLVMADETSEHSSSLKKSDRYFLIVGPEGGFSDNERNFLFDKKAGKFSLGANRLRTETAAVVITYQIKSGLFTRIVKS